MKRSVIIVLYAFYYAVLAINPDEIPLSPKDFTKQFQQSYNKRSKLFGRSYLRAGFDDNKSHKQNHKTQSGVTPNNKFFYNISNQNQLDTDIFKRSNISSYKRHKVSKKIRTHQQARDNVDSPIDNVDDSVGKAYGDPDNYQSIGDGVYLLNNPMENNNINSKVQPKTSSLKDKLPDTEKVLNALIKDLDEDSSSKSGERISAGKSLNLDDDSDTDNYDSNNNTLVRSAEQTDLPTDINDDGELSIVPSNIEGVIPKEIDLIKSIQKSLREDDKDNDASTKHHENDILTKFSQKTSDDSNASLENEALAFENNNEPYSKSNSLAIDSLSNSNKGFIKGGPADMNSLNNDEKMFFKSKSVSTDPAASRKIRKQNKEFIKGSLKSIGNSESLANSKVSDIKSHSLAIEPVSKKDIDLFKSNSLAIDSINSKELENNFMKTNSLAFDQANSKDDDYINDSTNSFKKDLTKYTDTHKYRRKTKNNKNRNLPKNTKNKNKFLERSNTEAEVIVGGSRSSHSPIRRLNKHDHSTKHKENLDSDTGFFIADEKDMADLNKKTEDYVSNTVNASVVKIIDSDNKPKHNKDELTAFDEDENDIKDLDQPGSDKSNVLAFKRPVSQKTRKKIDKQDLGLYNVLNRTLDLKKLRHKKTDFIIKNVKNGKSVSIPNKPGLTQIDLYISNNKNKKRKISRDPNVSKKEKTPELGLITAPVELNTNFDDVEDVSLSEVTNNQAKQMFNDNNQNGGIFGKHVEGNENKHEELNIQDAISSDDLQYAMKESDLKGLNQIQNELDFQETAKNDIDYFNQPDASSSKSLTNHRLSSSSIGDITEQIKEADSRLDQDLDKQDKSDDDQQKVKIILHIPENMSASNEKKKKKENKEQDANTLAMLTEQAKAFLNNDQTKEVLIKSKSSNDGVDKDVLGLDQTKEGLDDYNFDNSNNKNSDEMKSTFSTSSNEITNSSSTSKYKLDDETLEAAKKIEEFIKQESKKKKANEEDDFSDKPITSIIKKIIKEKKEKNNQIDRELEKTEGNIISPKFTENDNSNGDIDSLEKENPIISSSVNNLPLANPTPVEQKTHVQDVKSLSSVPSNQPLTFIADSPVPSSSPPSLSLQPPSPPTPTLQPPILAATPPPLPPSIPSPTPPPPPPSIPSPTALPALPSPTTLVNNAKNIVEKNSAKDTNKASLASQDLSYPDIEPVKILGNPLGNPRPTSPSQLIDKFITNIHNNALSKDTFKTTADGVLPNFQDVSLKEIAKAGGVMPLRINGGKVLGGNIRGGGIFGGVVSGGDVSGGEIHGGRITGGSFTNGMFMGGILQSGLVEGGKVTGGKITGGDIKSGVIEGGLVSGGTIDGGHLINGTVEGGIFKGGEIYGGKLISGEMDGGVLKNGTINGGLMKGGVIDSGSLEGGIMLSGILRGGIVKSGIIRGGIIDKGVVVQDAEIGPGVEIHEGIIKGGKITVNSIPQGLPGTQDALFSSAPIPEGTHTDENRSNIMYSIEVLPKPAENINSTLNSPIEKPIEDKKNLMQKNENNEHRHKNIKNDKSFLINSLNKMSGEGFNPSKKQPSIPQHKKEILKTTKKPNSLQTKKVPKVTTKKLTQQKSVHPSPKNLKVLPNKLFQHGTLKVIEALKRHSTSNVGYINNLLHMLETSAKKSEEENAMQKQTTLRMFEDAQQKRNEEATLQEDSPIAHWALTEAKHNYIEGKPGAKLRIYGGVTIRNGHAILDGANGYFDGGDYQGECMSDPEVCSNGFTLQMTLKVYSDSIFNASRLFIFDTGATSEDSRGISVWVSDGRIGTQVSTREEVFCTKKILEPFIAKWVSLTLTWRKDKGLFLYINCDLFDDASNHGTSECESCKNCHLTDRATRLMVGRPNKGPHFKVTHMAVGDILLHDRYSDQDDVKLICGSQGTSAIPKAGTTASPQVRKESSANSLVEQPLVYQGTKITNNQLLPVNLIEQPLIHQGVTITNNQEAPATLVEQPLVHQGTVLKNNQPSPPATLVEQPLLHQGVTITNNQEAPPATLVEQPLVHQGTSITNYASSNSSGFQLPFILEKTLESLNKNSDTAVSQVPIQAPILKPLAVSQTAPGKSAINIKPHKLPVPAPPSPFVVHINTPRFDDDDPYQWPTPSSVVRRIERDHSTPRPKTHIWPTPAFIRKTEAKPMTSTSTKSYMDMDADRRSILSLRNVNNNKRSKEYSSKNANGGYSEWTGWSPCSQTCGPGLQIAVRYCNKPLPKGTGRECTSLGAPRKFQACNLKHCHGHSNTQPLMNLDYGTKKSSVPTGGRGGAPMIIINGQQESFQDLEETFEQLKHR